MEPGPFDKSCFEMSKKIIRLLRHDSSVLREEDGAVEFRILAQIFHSEFTSSQHWSIRAWLNYLQKGGGPNKRFQYCVDPFLADTILFLRAVQDHSGGKHLNPTLQDNVTTGQLRRAHLVGSCHGLHSIIQSGLIPGAKDVKKGRHALFFTAVNPMFFDHYRGKDYDVMKPRIAVYKNDWKITSKYNKLVSREMVPPRHANNRRRRTREGTELACVQTRSGTRREGRAK